MWIKPVLLVLLGLTAAAQTDQYFTVGKIGVHLGDSVVTVLANLRSLYQVNSVGNDTYSVGQQQDNVYQTIGTVTFRNNKLVAAGSIWGESFEPSAVQFAKSVIDVIQHQQLKSPRTAIVRAIHRGNDLSPADGIEIVIGDRAIRIVTSTSPARGPKPNQPYAEVTENLHEHSYASNLAKEAGVNP
ncbi:MAG TPA: hypothetical protein VN633_00675 [Bryobacteraceae bacterium]|nr:hypothetical protein [Bryobacteraceae bacterium]